METKSAEQVEETRKEKNDQHNRLVSRESSWLYRMFEDHNLSSGDKSQILGEVMHDHYENMLAAQ